MTKEKSNVEQVFLATHWVQEQSKIFSMHWSLAKGHIDTSRFTDEIELLIGSIILHEVFNNYKRYKLTAQSNKPVISIIVEEAPKSS